MVSLQSTITLRNGFTMPLFGLGTFLATEGDCTAAVTTAIKAGYRLIDTAALYKNEECVAAGIRAAGVPREDLFIVTKLGEDEHGAEAAEKALDKSLALLDLPFVDLYLIHTPKNGKVLETWDTLLRLRDSGKIRSVGVSNFGAAQLAGLKAAGREMPQVNQFELHPWLQQRETVAYCKEEGIAVMGFCPLARGKQFGKTAMAELAAKLNVSEASLALSWAVRRGYVTIPKSVSEKRIVDNAQAASLELSPDDLAAIDGMDCGFKASFAVNAMDLPWDDVK